MIQPKSFTSTDESKVCMLQRSIYELKQTSRSWNMHFDKVIKMYGFVRNEKEPCIYKWANNSVVVFLVLYVDDILLIGNPCITRNKSLVIILVLYKGLGRSILHRWEKHFRSKRLLGLSQSMYIDTVLKRFSMENSKKGYLPIGLGISLSKKDCLITPQERECMSKILYISTVGFITYAIICTRSDVAHSPGVVSRYQSDSRENHWKIVKIILKYLRNTKDQWLIYRESNLKLIEFTDFNFQSDHDDSKSVSGYIYILNSGAICWKSFKQNTVTNSTCEMKYIIASDATKKAVWL